MDAKFIQGILNNPDLQPDAAVNRWIQGILMFHFTLIHVPATKFQGPDALSRRERAPEEAVESDDDTWLDQIALSVQESYFVSVTQDFERINPYTPHTGGKVDRLFLISGTRLYVAFHPLVARLLVFTPVTSATLTPMPDVSHQTVLF